MKKKIVKLNESDITKLVKKTLIKESDTYQFRLEYSKNLRRQEKTATDGDADLLDDIVDVYKTHIKQIQDYLKGKSDKEKESKNKD
jgi:hypothetical protein